MNFLLHHRLARRDLPSPAAAIGAMLPDLWRMIDKRIRPATSPIAADDPKVTAVLAGIAHHTRADAAFHDCEAFTAGERALARELAAIDAPKITLFAHIAWELCLDGALVRRDGDALARALREGVADATSNEGGEPATDVACRLHCEARAREAPADGFAARVRRFLDEIARGAWIAGYARGAVIAERVAGIRGRLGLGALATSDQERLGAILESALARADAPLEAILALPISPGSPGRRSPNDARGR